MNELKCTMFIDLINIITLQITKKKIEKKVINIVDAETFSL
jgi:hypothetical protein